MIDTHCHLHFSAYEKDRDEVIRRGLDASVRMITVGTNHMSSADAVALAGRVDGIWASIGLHPTHLFSDYHDESESATPMAIERFSRDAYRHLAQQPKVVAIGECGLEHFRLPEAEANSIKDTQRRVFREHCELATEQDLPLIIHCRDANQDMISILAHEISEGHLRRRGVIHSFTGTAADAAAYVKLGFYIGVNGIASFAKPRSNREFLPDVIRDIPLERLVLETDAPYLAPAPYRGKRNEPSYIWSVASFLAIIKNVPLEKIDYAATQNAKVLFGLT